MVAAAGAATGLGATIGTAAALAKLRDAIAAGGVSGAAIADTVRLASSGAVMGK